MSGSRVKQLKKLFNEELSESKNKTRTFRRLKKIWNGLSIPERRDVSNIIKKQPLIKE